MLADTPLLAEGTEVIIDALFGDANIPIPAPIITRGVTISLKVVVTRIPVRIKNPIADTNKPSGVKILSLDLSYNHPLKGANEPKQQRLELDKYLLQVN